jgi:glutamate synthase domain-containing protein 2
MMEEWGVPVFYIQCMTNELVAKLAEDEGAYIPDIAIAGGFSTEDHIYKVLALGSPHTKAVCMGRALMIPGFVGKNIELWMQEENLPKVVAEHGTTKEEIFVAYETVKKEYGDEVDNMPLGALALYTFSDKLKVGLQQLMSGSRKFDTPSISRSDVFALTEEAARISGLDYVMDVQREEAMRIISE